MTRETVNLATPSRTTTEFQQVGVPSHRCGYIRLYYDDLKFFFAYLSAAVLRCLDCSAFLTNAAKNSQFSPRKARVYCFTDAVLLEGLNGNWDEVARLI